MLKEIKRALVGRPLKNEDIHGEKFSVLWGLPVLSSDAISSVAYAGQEMLIVLLPVVGIAAFAQISILSGAIIGLLAILVLSYRQTITNYPNGGGAYIVAKDNLGVIPGVTAGAALAVDYVLTVAVSVSSGVEQIVSATPFLQDLNKYGLHANVIISVIMVLLLMIGNLRGLRESSRIFGFPAYAFIFAMLAMIVVGFAKVIFGYHPNIPVIVSQNQPVTLGIMLVAFASGCTALTGVEAVSNAVPNFKDPAPKHARTVLVLLALIILVLFGGSSILANIYQVDPREHGALLVLIANEVFGGGFMFYFLTISTFTILIMAANTSYADFPMLISVMSRDGYAPRQLSRRGDRLSYDSGIIMLSVIAAILIIIFNANVTALIGLYAIGVFISFTLSQSGMFVRWLRHKGEHWHLKAAINGFGAVVTAIVVVIIAFTKFAQGAWIVVILIPTLIFLMLRVKRHYVAVYMQLRIPREELKCVSIENDLYKNLVIVPIDSINKSSIRALRYAKTISQNVTAFNVAIDEEAAKEIREKYMLLDTDIPLVVKYSPFRKVVEPLLKFIQSAEYDYVKGDMITVILPQFAVNKWWHRILHNNTRQYIEGELLKHKHIVVSVMPLQLKDDAFILKSEQTK